MKTEIDYDTENVATIAEVAGMYYQQGIPQNVIAQQMFYSKSKVSRLLRLARELGIVEITIKYPIERMPELEEALQSSFGLRDAIVIHDYHENNSVGLRLGRLGRAASSYLDGLLRDGDTVGLSWGRTLRQMVLQLNPSRPRNIRVVQVMGAAADHYQSETDSPTLVRGMAEKYGGSYSQLYAPLFVNSDIVKKLLIKEPVIARALTEAAHVRYLITGIADFTAGDSTISWAGYLTDELRESLLQKGTQGFLCGHFLDKAGRPVSEAVESHLIGITLGEIRKIENVIAVAGGVEKAHATLAALRGGYLNCLITDEHTARQVLAQSGYKAKGL